MKGRCFMNLKKIIAAFTASLCVLCMCVACSRNDAQNDPADNNGSTINGTDNTTGNTTDKNDLTDSMDELKDDVKDTADDIKDNLTGESDAGAGSDGTNNSAGSAYNNQTSN